MGTVAVIGDAAHVSAFALTGALVIAVDDERGIRRAWSDLDSDVTVAVLSPAANAALVDTPSQTHVLRVVMPR